MPNNNPKESESTAFTLDNMGRFLCNTAHEALTSAGVNVGIGTPPPDARPFDVIVIGGGTFGSVIAQHLYFNDKTFSRRILVLERGPFALPEHFQNMSFMGGLPNWVRPWEKNFSGDNAGLRICLGGRSLEWGGWSPEPLAEELAAWPASVAAALKNPVDMEGSVGLEPGYFEQSGEQIGANDTNDFIYGPLHHALRKILADGLKASPAFSIISALPLAQWPDHPRVRRFAKPAPDSGQLRGLLGFEKTDPVISDQEMRELLRVEAPLAVQSRADAGQFPVNKFSALPLLVTAARAASTESLPYDQHKRLMVVPNWHVQEIITQTLPNGDVKVTAVRIARPAANAPNETLDIPLADSGVVVLAQGTVESTRLAYQTFQDSLSWRAAQRMGKNLVAHLRSNLTIRVPRSSIANLPDLADVSSLQVSALFVKGKANVGGKDRYFHLQITASAVALPTETNSEAELFKKIPDYDNIERLKRATDETVVITLRGIGEMLTHNPDSHIAPTNQSFDFDRPKALVTIGDSKAYAEALANGTIPPMVSAETKLDVETWEKMDALADEVAIIFGGGKEFEVLRPDGTVEKIPAFAGPNAVKAALRYVDRRDGLGTTHHEGGTLRMGDDIATSVTDGFGRIHDTTNCFCAGPALFPSVGSPNPMLTGVALARRSADFLSRRLKKPKPAGAFTSYAPIEEDSREATWLYRITDTAQQRQFGHVDWLGERFVISLPLPWQAVSNFQPVPVQVMVHMEPRQDGTRIGVVVEDPDFAPMAGLMTASTLPKAVVAVKQARDMLFGKMLNPLGAAAGGYVLLAAGDREDDSWHGWIDNLANLFPNIPDGAILKASLRLRFPKTESSAEEARASLLDAFDRGIPYYSAGVSWLLDGMTRFADDPAVADKIKLVHRVALRLDVTQAFTVIRISERRKQ
jgi:choline dehydrogenase-like flavoprotein